MLTCTYWHLFMQIPVSVHLWLEPVGTPRAVKRRQSRKLLNAEKIMFRTGSNGGILYQGKDVSLNRSNVHYQGSN
jgi:hypothetical protein